MSLDVFLNGPVTKKECVCPNCNNKHTCESPDQFYWGWNITHNMNQKIAISRFPGGCFELSDKAVERICESGITVDHSGKQIFRGSPFLTSVIEELGVEASGESAFIKVVEIPENVRWYIVDNDGVEEIHELHRIWS